MAAHGEHQFAEEVERMIITGLRDVVDMADELPGRHEQPFALQLEELRIDVGPGRQARHRLAGRPLDRPRSEEHTSELQSLMRISNAVFCLKKKILECVYLSLRL